MSPTLLRILDVNCNRVREALRVLEDYARFSLNHRPLQQQLKQLRHDFQTATASVQAQAISARDTAGDVGTGITTETEQKRESLSAVVTAAGKRLSEALRSVEEYLKTADGANAACVEQIRYRAYDIERAILLTLSPGRERMRGVSVYVLITESLCKRPWLEVARLAIDGGCECIQLREKLIDAGELLVRARRLAALCRERGVISIINDRPDVALAAGADGVHVGQADLPARVVRQIVGPDLIVGVSTRQIEQAREAVLDGADYIGVGPIFASTTKPQENLPGLAYAKAAAAEMSVPVVAISGVCAGNVVHLAAIGVRAVAVSSAVIAADDPSSAVRQIRAALSDAPSRI